MMMKVFRSLFCVCVLFVLTLAAAAQSRNAAIEKEIRRLDLEAANAVLNKDEKAIARFFTSDSVTNNPRNGLTRGSAGVIDAAKSGLINYYSFDRTVESVQV
ncbi:MAG TPA: nuclear transport factor 2 family protein, partial [Pyrinomonadaceae bacterium]|nr:nuclear transport factor 2 family protein [Pyrinomonadaceae bacterium]